MRGTKLKRDAARALRRTLENPMQLDKLYEGTKRMRAAPMTRGEYNAYRGWQNPEGENPADAGYLVEYEDGGKANDSRHTGYISWSPADVFERTYKEVSNIPDQWADLPPHQRRVMVEKGEVSERLSKLLAFFATPLFAGLSEAERARLRSQARFMDGYAAVLEERIAAFPA